MGLPKNKQTDALFSSVLMLRDVEECYRYFEDLCTIQEIRDLGQRLEIAKALDAGDTYQSAIEKTGVSTATIGRNSRPKTRITGFTRRLTVSGAWRARALGIISPNTTCM